MKVGEGDGSVVEKNGRNKSGGGVEGWWTWKVRAKSCCLLTMEDSGLDTRQCHRELPVLAVW
jgi:hypothetical protein